jgi:hypothetical protein
METAGAILVSIIAAFLGYQAGGRWVPTPVVGVILFSVPLGVVSVGLYVVLALCVTEMWPDSLDARLVAFHSLAVFGAGVGCGALGTVFGYRKSLGARLF